jgi:hypothetical protein
MFRLAELPFWPLRWCLDLHSCYLLDNTSNTKTRDLWRLVVEIVEHRTPRNRWFLPVSGQANVGKTATFHLKCEFYFVAGGTDTDVATAWILNKFALSSVPIPKLPALENLILEMDVLSDHCVVWIQ